MTDTQRFEKKFAAHPEQYHHLKSYLYASPAHFTSLHEPRRVYNLYLDTLDYQSALAHMSGIESRHKIRIRWYGPISQDKNPSIIKPQLEIKSKVGELVIKTVYPLKESSLPNLLGKRDRFELIASSDLPESLKITVETLVPTLLNSYQRSYYLSSHGLVRATIDENIRFSSPSAQHLAIPLDQCILEFKYGLHEAGESMGLLKDVPFRFSRSSKYINGLTGLQGTL